MTGSWTPSRRRGLEVLGWEQGRARVGMGMWSCTAADPIVSSAAAAWLVGNGFAAEEPGWSDVSVIEITDAGRAAWAETGGGA